MPGREYDDRVDEEAEDDRRRRQQNVVDEARRAREPAVTPELGEVNAGEDADRRADERRRADDQRAADDRIRQAAARARWWRRLPEERRRQRRVAVAHEHDEDPEQEKHAERHRREREREVHPIDEQAQSIAARRHVCRPSPRESAAISAREAASTETVSTNRKSPSAISAPRCTGSEASLNSFASADAIVLPGSNSDARIR